MPALRCGRSVAIRLSRCTQLTTVCVAEQMEKTCARPLHDTRSQSMHTSDRQGNGCDCGVGSMSPLHVSNEEFRSLAARMTSIAADFLEHLSAMRAYPRTSGAQITEVFEAPLPEEGMQGRALDA